MVRPTYTTDGVSRGVTIFAGWVCGLSSCCISTSFGCVHTFVETSETTGRTRTKAGETETRLGYSRCSWNHARSFGLLQGSARVCQQRNVLVPTHAAGSDIETQDLSLLFFSVIVLALDFAIGALPPSTSALYSLLWTRHASREAPVAV